MIRRFVLGLLRGFLFACLIGPPAAFAGVPCSVPFNLQNGTTADASQVMANYNAILSCLANSAAASGANSDITSLTGLTTPLSPSQGGTTTYIAGSVGGTNTIVISVLPAGYALTAGNTVRFLASAANTGATTLQVNSTTAVAFDRQTPTGPQPMVGGEIVAGQMVEAIYDGTEYQMVSQPALGHAPGEVFDFAGPSCPVGSLEATGATNVVQTAYPTLFALLGTTWGASGVGGANFTIPDLRGRTTFSRDSGGSGRITAAGGNFDGTAVGNTGGQQSKVVDQVNLRSFSFPSASGTVSGGTSGGTSTSSITYGGGSGPITVMTGSTAISVSTTVSSGGSATPLPTLSNGAIVLKCIKG